MATQFDTQLQQLYVAYFNRPADPDGLAFYADKLATNATTIAAISASFAASTEYRNEYNQTTFAGVVTKVYQNLFGHGPDAAGLALYTEALTNRTMTVDQMVTWIANGAQGSDKVAYDSKVTVATAFTNAVNTPEEIAGYNVTAAQTAAKAMLAGITTATQATAAVAAIDTQVATIIKAGVEFSLATGLANLDAATTARADFLEDFAEANDDATPTDALAAAKIALATEISNPAFAGASAGVQAALIADQVTANNATLVAANAALKLAQDNVAKVAGLNTAIAASTSAQTAVETAEDAALDAEIALTNAQTNFSARNTGVTTSGTVEGGDFMVMVGTTTVALMKDGALTIPSTVTAANYAGLTAYVAAVNADASAEADLEAATDAATLAQLQVELLDLEGTSVPAGSFTFNATTAPTTITYASIVNELSALTAAALTATPANAAAAELALTNFRGQITTFIETNDTLRADAVKLAEEGTLAQAQAAFNGIEGLAEAVEAKEAFDAAVAIQTTAAQARADAETAFETAEPTVVVATNGTVTVDNNGTIVTLVSLVDGKLVVAADAETEYAGVTAYAAAANTSLAADAAVTAAALSPAEVTLLNDNEAAVEALELAQTNATSTTAAVRAAALGTAGAQDAIDDLSEAQADLATAQAAADQLKSLDAAVKAATDEFAANDYVAPMMLGISAFGTTASDIFVATDVNSTIANFGRSGDDVLFVGSGYTLNEGALTTGNNAALEVFFTQRGANTVVTIESKAYGSESMGGDIHTVTLTGVNAADLNFENGIISL